VSIRFEDTGSDFSALRQAEAWCRERDYTMGCLQRGAPMGLKRGDCFISKWRNMDAATRRIMDGEVHGEGGSFREGWVEIRLRADERANRAAP